MFCWRVLILLKEHERVLKEIDEHFEKCTQALLARKAELTQASGQKLQEQSNSLLLL